MQPTKNEVNRTVSEAQLSCQRETTVVLTRAETACGLCRAQPTEGVAKTACVFRCLLAALLAVLLALPMEAGSFVVVLDAGHGGKDPGCVGSVPSHREKDVALAVTRQIGKLLETEHPGIDVIYTRTGDRFVELGRRAEIANRAHADLFVSIHVNAVDRRSASRPIGVQAYTLSLSTAAANLEVEKRENSVIALEGEAAARYNYGGGSEGDIMFEIMQDKAMRESVAFAQMAQEGMTRGAGRRDMGVRQANFAVLRLTYMPSALLEIGFMSTPEEERFLMSEQGQNLLARHIAAAVAKYAGEPAPAPAPDVSGIPDEGDAHSPEPATQPVEAEPALSPETAVQPVEENPAHSKEPAVQTAVPSVWYGVQVLSGHARLRDNDPQLKGLSCQRREKDGYYTYVYGHAATRDEAQALRKQILKLFPTAFVVTIQE